MLTWGNWSFNTSCVFPVFYINQEKKKSELLKFNKAHTKIFKIIVNAQIADSQFNERNKMLNYKTIK